MGKKKPVQICSVHPGVNNAQDLYDMFGMHLDDLEYEFIWNDENPEYLVASSVLYEDWKVWEAFKRLYSRAKVCIFHSGECEAPDLNIFDYAICYNAHLQEDDRIFRLPTRFFHQDKIFRMKNELENQPKKACKELLRKKMFCNFIYSNANGAEERTEIFKAVSLYKRVDSLGAYLNNTSVCRKTSIGDTWRSIIAESIEMKRNYKFSIAFENALYPGYTSEKLFSSLEAHTIPIYWGNPYIEEEVNEDAIINCHKFTSFAEVVERIREVDSNDAMWCQMVSESWLTEKQIELEKKRIEQYMLFLHNIFMQPIHQARRRGRGSCPSRYEDWFFAEVHGRYLLEQARDRKNYAACAKSQKVFLRYPQWRATEAGGGRCAR